MASGEIAQNGWDAMPVDPSSFFKGKPFVNEPGPLLVSDINFPDEHSIVAKVRDFAKAKLPRQTFQHSMRVYYYGTTTEHRELLILFWS